MTKTFCTLRISVDPASVRNTSTSISPLANTWSQSSRFSSMPISFEANFPNAIAIMAIPISYAM
jgi:hypothetical protein